MQQTQQTKISDITSLQAAKEKIKARIVKREAALADRFKKLPEETVKVVTESIVAAATKAFSITTIISLLIKVFPKKSSNIISMLSKFRLLGVVRFMGYLVAGLKNKSKK